MRLPDRDVTVVLKVADELGPCQYTTLSDMSNAGAVAYRVVVVSVEMGDDARLGGVIFGLLLSHLC